MTLLKINACVVVLIADIGEIESGAKTNTWMCGMLTKVVCGHTFHEGVHVKSLWHGYACPVVTA